MMRISFLRRFALAAAVVLAAQQAQQAGADGHSSRGAELAYSCAGCHSEAQAAAGIPSLDGRDAKFIAEALREFKSGARFSTVMGRLAKGYDDDEIDAIAKHLGAGQ